VALHGAGSALHDTITRVPGGFKETVAGIAALMDLGFPICGKMVLSRYNTPALPASLVYLHKRGINDIVVAFPHAEDFSPSALQDVLPRYADVKNALCALSWRPQPPLHITWETIPFCVFPDPSFFPSSLDLTHLQADLQNAHTIIEMSMTGERIEWEKSRKSIKSKNARCGLCLMEHVCEGVWSEYFDLYDGDDLEPIQDHAAIQAFLEKL